MLTDGFHNDSLLMESLKLDKNSKMIRGLEQLRDGDRLREFWVLQHGEEKAARRPSGGPSVLERGLRKSWGGTFHEGMLRQDEGKWLGTGRGLIWTEY